MADAPKELSCPHCGSAEISQGLRLRLGNPLTDVGLVYDKGVLFSAVEPLLLNVCKKCGTVQRIYVEHPNREWD